MVDTYEKPRWLFFQKATYAKIRKPEPPSRLGIALGSAGGWCFVGRGGAGLASRAVDFQVERAKGEVPFVQGVDSPFFSAIVLFKHQPFLQVFGGKQRSHVLQSSVCFFFFFFFFFFPFSPFGMGCDQDLVVLLWSLKEMTPLGRGF